MCIRDSHHSGNNLYVQSVWLTLTYWELLKHATLTGSLLAALSMLVTEAALKAWHRMQAARRLVAAGIGTRVLHLVPATAALRWV